MVQLKKALYGHPDSGTFWEQHCDDHARAVGFAPVGPEWPSCYFHAELQLFLVVYVDDFKLSGPADKLALGWELIRRGITAEDPHPLDHYLGCLHEQSTRVLPDTGATVYTVDLAVPPQSLLDWRERD